MKLDLLTAISPIDGRYRGKTERLADYFSEYALIRYRVRVEIEYFITLCELPLPQLASFDHQLFDHLRDIYRNFGEEEAQRVKDIEKVTNHDVKAVEYFIKEEFDRIGGLDAYKEENQSCFCKRIAIGKIRDSFSLLVAGVSSGLLETQGPSWSGCVVVGRWVWKML